MITGSGASDRLENDDALSPAVPWLDPTVEIGVAGTDCDINFGSLSRASSEWWSRESLANFLVLLRKIGLAFTGADTWVAVMGRVDEPVRTADVRFTGGSPVPALSRIRSRKERRSRCECRTLEETTTGGATAVSPVFRW